MRKSIIPILAFIGAFAVVGCDSRTEREVKTTDSGTTVVHKETTVEVDPHLKEAGRELKEAGKDAAQDVKEGVDEAAKHVPDVDVDVKVKPSEAEREKNPSH